MVQQRSFGEEVVLVSLELVVVKKLFSGLLAGWHGWLWWREDPFLDAEEGAVLSKEVTDEVVMASQVDIDASKKARTTKKRNFTRKVNEFKEQVGKDFNVLKAAYEEIDLAYSELVKASDEYDSGGSRGGGGLYGKSFQRKV